MPMSYTFDDVAVREAVFTLDRPIIVTTDCDDTTRWGNST